MIISKLRDQDELAVILEQERKNGRKIVFTNGCFDILHLGHVEYLKEASQFGDILVIGLNSDTSVSGLKGPKKPIYPENERAEILSALRYVDYVSIFSESTPINLIRKLKPDVLVKGGDYNLDNMIGKDFVESINGRVLTIPFIQGKSTTNIIEKVCRIS